MSRLTIDTPEVAIIIVEAVEIAGIPESLVIIEANNVRTGIKLAIPISLFLTVC